MGFLIIAVSIFVGELFIKSALDRPWKKSGPKELFHGRVRVQTARNYGLVMNHLDENPELPAWISGIIFMISLIFYLPTLFRKKVGKARRLGAALLLGGAASNVYDRWRQGYVVDYLTICWKKLKKIVFNLSDLCIFAGTFLLFITEFRNGKKGK